MPEQLSKEESEAIIMACAAELSEVVDKHFQEHPQLGVVIGLSGGYGTYVAHNGATWHEAWHEVLEMAQQVSEAVAEEQRQSIVTSIPQIRELIAAQLGVDLEKVEVVSIDGVPLDGYGDPADTERELQRIEDAANESNT